jgi:hypothetical protein
MIRNPEVLWKETFPRPSGNAYPAGRALPNSEQGCLTTNLSPQRSSLLGKAILNVVLGKGTYNAKVNREILPGIFRRFASSWDYIHSKTKIYITTNATFIRLSCFLFVFKKAEFPAYQVFL